ncbi:unnamed protein product [Closterium sp. NIES-64]|nr:unnamed protein product [Closterium sp. NIES-64]CAI6010621.1 unnamed protein product [Closterium sp. NIES-65]
MARLSGIAALSLLLAVALVLSAYASKAVAQQVERTSDGKYSCADVRKGQDTFLSQYCKTHFSFCDSPTYNYYDNDCKRAPEKSTLRFWFNRFYYQLKP